MRMIALLPLLIAAACSVDTDRQNDQVTVEFNEERIENATEDVGNAAEGVAADIGNSIGSTGQHIENEIEDIDVDIDVRRGENRNSN